MRLTPASLSGFAVLLLSAATLSACATPETRLRTKLVDAGISYDMADCMAGYMVDRLSITQLRRMQSLASIRSEDLRKLTIAEYLHKVRALQDPEILTVTTKSTVICALG
ncbi:MAG: hypothetical protein E2598_00565 [Sphingobium sp.]|nr:hypothetical protein [Sphingobium sp.]